MILRGLCMAAIQKVSLSKKRSSKALVPIHIPEKYIHIFHPCETRDGAEDSVYAEQSDSSEFVSRSGRHYITGLSNLLTFTLLRHRCNVNYEPDVKIKLIN